MPNTGNPSDVLTQRVEAAAQAMKIAVDEAFEKLAKLGIEKDDEDALALLEAETTTSQDAQDAFDGVPVARFRAGWAILKGKAKKTEEASGEAASLGDVLSSLKDIRRYKDAELLDAYSPDASTEIYDELNKRSHNRPFLVYDGETLNKDLSLKMLREARSKETNPTHSFLKDGKTVTVRLLRVGEFPQLWLYQSPIHPDIILVDGYCSECDNTWEGVSMDDRVIVRVAVDADGVDVGSKAKIHELIQRVRKEGANFLLDVPAVKLRYDELKDIGRLPTLRQRPGTSASGTQDPFYQHKTY